MHRFLVVIEKANRNYSAYSPDLPGCVATGTTPQKVKENIRKAIEMHIFGLQEDREPIPKPMAMTDYVKVA